MSAGSPTPQFVRATLSACVCALAAAGGCDSSSGDGASPDLGPEAARQAHCDRVFVLDDKSNLALFDPKTLRFEDVGRLPCPLVDLMTPTSIAVSRIGVIFVEYPSGDLFRLPLDVRTCSATDFFFGYGGQAYGMSFATNAPGSVEETLYAARQEVAPYVFGIMNLGALDMTAHGYVPADAVLAGSGAGDLWAVSRGSPGIVGRVERPKPRLFDEFPLAELGDTTRRDGNDLAAAFFRSNLWLFASAGSSTSIYRLDPQSRVVTRMVADAGRRVVAAASSTCASP